MGRAAGLHDNAAGGTIGEEAIEASAAQALPFDNMPALIRQGDLEDILCKVDADSRSIHE
jgi:hypothetical protein